MEDSMVRSSWLLRWWIIIWTKISFSGGWHCLGNLKNPMIHLTILITQIRYLPLSLGYLVASCDHGRWMWWFWFCQTSKVLVQENSKLSKKTLVLVFLQPRFFSKWRRWEMKNQPLKTPFCPYFMLGWFCFFWKKNLPRNHCEHGPPHRVVS